VRKRLFGSLLVLTILPALGLAALLGPTIGEAQAGRTFQRLADGKPNLNGIWQTMNTANWNLEPHAAAPAPVLAMGAAGAIPPGLGVVEGGTIPYLPGARARKDENAKNWLTADPEVKCYLPGVPRATYMPHPFQIVQSRDVILIAYQYASASRTIPLAPRTVEPPVETWMGDSVGRWEGDTLVVETDSFNDQTWFDRAGNYHSEALRVVERYTPIDVNLIQYEATIEDPTVFSRPWKISLPLYRRVEPNVQLIEFKCVEFVEELMYGHLRKK
jgi:hypothetical protein